MLRGLLRLMGIYKLYELWLKQQIKDGKMPEHVAVILDGNRRWARQRGLPPWAGHEEGAKKVEEFLQWCLDLGVKTVTLYAFSTENFNRKPEEVREIMRIIREEAERLLDDERIHKHRVRVKVLGRKDLLPEDVKKALEEAEERTKEYDQHFLNLAVAYGGRAEIVDAMKKIAELVKKGELKIDEIDEKTVERCLYTSHLPKPDPDMIIRTSGEERLSNFLLWQSAYSELIFLDVYWPDFRKIDFLRAIRTYQKRHRRFGR